MNWIDRGHYYEHTAPQGTPPWKLARLGRINSSNSGAMANKSIFSTPEETGKIIAGVEEAKFDLKSIEVMKHGTETEPTARDWYENTYKCSVLERGLCVCKSDVRIGASVDGEVIETSGIIEIKCPQKFYRPISQYMENMDHGWKPPSGYYDHIWPTHFSQMQHGMFVLKKDWCDYIVYCTSTSQVFTQRIPFLPEYWKEHYKILDKNYNLYIKPYLNFDIGIDY